jgi:uncharacterized repeat protein (TIGR02543 family)
LKSNGPNIDSIDCKINGLACLFDKIIALIPAYVPYPCFRRGQISTTICLKEETVATYTAFSEKNLNRVPVLTKQVLMVLAFIIPLVGTSITSVQADTTTFTGGELLGKPTDSSITINIVPDSTIEYYYEYGTVSGVYTNQTPPVTATGGLPDEVTITDLIPDTRYFYRMVYDADGDVDDDNFEVRDEHTFHTQRAQGEEFVFTITSDSHAQYNASYQQAMTNIFNDQPDFNLDLGDTFMVDGTTSQSAVDTDYLAQRDPLYIGRIGPSVPIFLAAGNHEEEEGWNLDDTLPGPEGDFSAGVGSIQARKAYFPTPSAFDDPFYSANVDPLARIDESKYGDDYREDYYAWIWGDALFVVIDPFQYTMDLPYSPIAGEGSDDPVTGDQWSWTLGIEQYLWLKDVLEFNSDMPYKFVFSHHMLGGIPNGSVSGGAGYVRGGAEAAAYFEWGGKNANGSWGFDTQRSALDGWTFPIHELFVDNGVSAYFHGHDHQYVYEQRDGIVYQEMPSPSMSGSGFGGIYAEGTYGEYDTIEMLPNSGHLRITVNPTEATVQYISSGNYSSNGTINYTYTIEPNSVVPPVILTMASDGNGTTNPVVGAHNYAEGTVVSIGATPSSGYVFDSWSGDADCADGSVTMNADKTCYANFVEAPPTGEVTVDGISSGTTANGVVSFTFDHTSGTGMDRLMLVGLSINNYSTEPVINEVAFEYDSTSLPLTLVEEIDYEGRHVAIYGLVDPPSGQIGTVYVEFGSAIGYGIVAGATNFAGVDQYNPWGTFFSASGQSAAPSVDLTGLAGNELVFDTVFMGAATIPTMTPGPDQTQLWNRSGNRAGGVASIEEAVDDTVTMSWTTGGTSVYWAIGAVPINPAPASGTTYDLTIASDGNGTTVPAVGVHTYAEGTVVTIDATPASGYQFDYWSGACTGSGTCQLTMDGDRSVTAHFMEAAPSNIAYVGDIGSTVLKTFGTDLTINTTAAVEAGDDIIIVYVTDPNANVPPINVTDTVGNAYTQVDFEVNTGQLRTYVFAAFDVNPLPAGGSITISANASVTARAAVVSVFSGLDDEDVVDQTSTGENDNSTTASSGATAATTQTDELLIGGIGTEGPDGDNAGTWQDAFTAGPRLGTTGGNADTNITASLGWRIVSSVGSYTASKTGMTQRDHASVIATFKSGSGGTAPRITITGTPLDAFTSIPGTPSAEQSYEVSGSNLTDDISINAPSDFEISLSSGTNFGSSLTLPQTDGAVVETTIYVRFNRASEGTSSGNITHTSPDATARNVAVTGTAAPLSPVAFSILLGRPTDHSVTANIIPDQDAEFYAEYGTSSGTYSNQTGTFTATADEPVEIVIDGLSGNATYYYRLVYRQTGTTEWNPAAEHSIVTQKAPGSTFTFTIASDSHLGQYGGQTADELALYDLTMKNIAADNPDFHIDDGDTTSMDPSPLGTGMTEAEAEAAYLVQRPYLDNFSASVPFFLAIGNHENEEGWNWDDEFTAPDKSLAIVGLRARKKYFPNPVPDVFDSTNAGFYTGNEDPLPNDIAVQTGNPSDEDYLAREEYFAWTWGDALFIVLDPYHYSMTWPNDEGTGYGGEGQDGEVSGDRWDWTLGIEQYLWLKETLENSNAKYKFVFSHQVTGGETQYGRGGASAAPFFEWGGQNLDGTWGWDDHRPAAEGWDVPIHQLFVDNGVDIYIHGHDHIYAREELDGIIYLEVAKPDDAGYDWDPYGYGYNEDLYPNAIVMIPNSGYIRVTVSPAEATFEYVRSYLPGDGENGVVADSFIIEGDVTTDHTVIFNSNGGTGSMADQTSDVPTALTLNSFTRTGYSFTGWNTVPGGGGTSYADGATYSFAENVTLYAQWLAQPDHTVTFDGNGSTAGSMSPQTENVPTALTPNAFTRAGYTFAGWNTASNGSGASYVDNATYDFSLDITLYAQWTAISIHTVTFDLGDHGTRTGGGELVQTVAEGGTAVAPTITVEAGWTFDGWDTSFTNVTSDLTVTAQYSQVSYTLNYAAGPGGSLSGDPVQTVNYGGNGTAVTAVPDIGYHFVDWSDGSTANPRTDTNVTADLNVTANFEINSYTVTFVLGNHGTLDSGELVQTVSHGGSALAPTITVEAGWTFDGWNTSFTNVTSDLTVTAQYSQVSYSVTFDPNGGSGTMSPQTANVPTALTLNTFTRTGYSFTEWNTVADGSGTGYADGATYSFGEDITLYAQWSLPTISVLITNTDWADDNKSNKSWKENNRRIWTFTLTNDGPGAAEGSQITSLKFAQSSGTECNPISETEFPLQVGNIPPDSEMDGLVTIDFTGCPPSARFDVTVKYKANEGVVDGTTTIYDQSR